MIKVLSKVVRNPGEGVRPFKRRCSEASLAAKHPTWSFAVGRFAEIAPGLLDSVNSMKWGFESEELPSDVCVIAAFSKDMARHRELSVAPEEILNAPVFEVASVDFEGTESEFLGYMNKMREVLKERDGLAAIVGGNYMVLSADGVSLGCGGVFINGSCDFKNICEPSSDAWEESWKAQIDEWIAAPRYRVIPESDLEVIRGGLTGSLDPAFSE